MDFDLTEEQTELRATIRRYLAAEVEPLVEEHERAGTFPFEVMPVLAEFGYLGGWLDRARYNLGGLLDLLPQGAIAATKVLMADDQDVALAEALYGAAQVGADGLAQERRCASAVGIGKGVHDRGL